MSIKPRVERAIYSPDQTVFLVYRVEPFDTRRGEHPLVIELQVSEVESLVKSLFIELKKRKKLEKFWSKLAEAQDE